MNSLRQYVETLASFRDESQLEALVLERGQAFEWKPLPDELYLGAFKQCYRNSFSQANHRFTYCEGYAYRPGSIPMEHAWLVDTDDGKAVEPTWRDGGRDCGFCEDGVITLEDDDATEVECTFCDGKGELDWEHPRLAGTEYLGLLVPTKVLWKVAMETKYFSVFGTQRGLDLFLEMTGVK